MSIILPQTRGVLHAGKDPYFSSVVFLNHLDALDGSNFDSTVGGDLSPNGTPATLSTTQVKFGAKSLYCGAGLYDFGSNSTNYGPGAGDFTWEGWIYTTSLSVQQGVFAIGANGVQSGQRIYIYTDGSIFYYWNAANRILSAASVISINTWHFWQLRRIGTSTQLAVDGVQVGSTYTDSNNYAGGALWVGASNYPGLETALRGYIDDVRITNGVGRAFAVPTAAFPNS